MVDVDILDVAYEKAVETVNICSNENGLFASGGKKGYKGVWSRDSFITMLGASLVSEEHKDYDLIKRTFRRSLETLGKYQSKKGQVPNAVYDFGKKNPKVDYLSIDSSLWFVIGHYVYRKRYGDGSLFRRHEKKIEKAIFWLSYQDMGEDVMLEQLPTTDWQDAFPHKYGKTINTQALYYFVLRLAGKRKVARRLKFLVNKKEGYRLWNGDFYHAYRWKNHNKYKEIGEWFDSFGNLLAIVFGLADKKMARKIVAWIKEKSINEPYPMKAIFPPIKKGDKEWKNYYLDCDAGKPYHYLNGGIWPFIGGFYVLALIRIGQYREARIELGKLAEANMKGNLFPEWVNPITKETHGIFQAWSAGAYILAYESLKRKGVLV